MVSLLAATGLPQYPARAMSSAERHDPTASRIQPNLETLDIARLKSTFARQNEFIAIDDCFSADAIAPLLDCLPSLEPRVHRNFIPRHKKGGSISRFDLDRYAPAFAELYRSEGLSELLCALCNHSLKPCPDDDPHTYALYYYTEAGDHIGYHYDTSYYKGARYTVLIGLVDESNCKLEYELFRDDPERTQLGTASLKPGTLVFFNGDKLWHRVTPCGENERRIALTLEFVTSHEMNPLLRFVSNMKDSIAYFGFRQVFAKPDTPRE